MKKFFFIIFMIFMPMLSFGQYHTSNKKAIVAFEQALNDYAAENYTSAMVGVDKALKTDVAFIEAWWLKSEIAAKQNDNKGEVDALLSAYKIDQGNETTICGLGDAYLNAYKNDSAIYYYQQLFKLPVLTEKIRNSANIKLETAKFRKNALEHPSDIQPINLGGKVNTIYNDYFPAISADGNTLVYTIELPQVSQNPLLPVTQEDIFITKRDSRTGLWQQARSIGSAINTYNNEGAPFISADGRILFFTSCTCPDGMIKCCDIYFSVNRTDGWTLPQQLPSPVNTSAWESQPSFSADGKTLYFTSNRKGGFGGKDIWFSHLNDDGSWTEPENAGPNVNTDKDETSPFIHADGQTLYFSSNGFIGMGGQDLYVSKKQADGQWGKPINLGYPINSKGNESRLSVSVLGNKAIISSDRNTDTKIDLYEINLPQQYRPHRTFFVEGSVIDAKTGTPLKSHFELVNLQTRQIVQTGNTIDDYYNILLFLPKGNDYALNVASDGYLMKSVNFSLKNIPDSVTKKYLEIPLDKILTGKTVVLENIFFETDKYDLKPESYYELDKLLKFLDENPTLKVEIGGHTDNVGSSEHNAILSKKRALTIVKYLSDNGISISRLTAEGYGDSKPCADNSTEQGRAKNRRTEFKIIE